MTTSEQINSFWAASGLSNPAPPPMEPKPLTPEQQHFFELTPRRAPHQRANESSPTAAHRTAAVRMSDEQDAREDEARRHELVRKFFKQLG